jgi:peptide deformylase
MSTKFIMAESLQIAQLGNPILRQPARLIENISAQHIQHLINNLIVTVTAANGVGIAAPQVSEQHCVFIVASRPNLRYPHAPLMEPTAMVNPRLVDHSEEIIKDWEGCLSIPGIRGLVPRYRVI